MTDPDDANEPAIETLRICRSESRSVLDHRIALLDGIDDKALRTVRSSNVVLELLVSASQLAGSTWVRSVHWLGATAAVIASRLFSFSIVVGMAIYSVSNVPYGVGPTRRTEAIDGAYTERGWLTLLLGEYDEWTTEIRTLTESNAPWLTYVRGAFVGGVMLVAAAVAISLAGVSVRQGAIPFFAVAAAGLFTVRTVCGSEDR